MEVIGIGLLTLAASAILCTYAYCASIERVARINFYTNHPRFVTDAEFLKGEKPWQ